MGVSTDAILVYGISLGGPDDWIEDPLEFMKLDDDDAEMHPDMDGYLDRESGLPQYGEDGHDWGKLREFREQCPADLVWHCSYDCPAFILAVRGTEERALRGYPVEIKSLEPPDTALVERFRQWCAERGIEGEPKWWLCSMWG